APVIAAWDFTRDIGTDRVHDSGPHGFHGRTHQQPARAMTDHTWRGDALDWTRDPGSHGAIHFHDDDLVDAGWEPDFDLDLPGDLARGIYAVRTYGAGC